MQPGLPSNALAAPSLPARRPGAVHCWRGSPQARLRLFCFPYAGAGALAYREWPRQLPGQIDVYGLTYPGREARAGEALCASLDTIVDGLLPELRRHLQGPFALFGHSMGAYVAFQVALRLQALGLRPEHVFVSAARAPHVPERSCMHRLSASEFLGAVWRLNGFPPELRGNSELIAYALPILRADITACETHHFENAEPANFPLTAFGGEHDPRVAREDIDRWRAWAGGSFGMRIFAGDHFYWRQDSAGLMGALAAALEQA
jgi:medium-chain acyl-[acyl-carrier-protein] hydrolase